MTRSAERPQGGPGSVACVVQLARLAAAPTVLGRPVVSGRRYVVSVLVLSVAVALVGCSGDPEPVVAPTPTANTSSAEQTPTQSPSPPPAEKRETAQQFIRRWLAEYAALQGSGDSVAFRQMSTGCVECLAIASRLEGIYANGGWVKGGSVDVTAIRSAGRIDERESWIAEFDASPTRYKERARGQVRRLGGGHSGFRFVLTPHQMTFRIRELYQESL